MASNMLPHDRFTAARRFLEQQGRPLEAALARYHFDGASRAGVLDALAPYQNEDGGFGKALEPDLRAPESSTTCTAVAFQSLRTIGAVRDDEMAGRAFAYLQSTLDRDLWSWRCVPESAEASPHAPWWNQTGRVHGYDDYNLNPAAELLGYVYERPGTFSPADVAAITERAMRQIENQDEMEMHDQLCCLRLFSSAGLPETVRERLRGRLAAFAEQAVVQDPAKWSGYGLRPLQVATHPASVFLPPFEAAVARNLDYEIAQQQADGSWLPTWSWGEAYPEVWPTAQREWSSVVTLRTLLLLDRFGRIAEEP